MVGWALHCRILEIPSTSKENPFWTYPAMMTFHGMTCLWGILPHSSHALSMLPHFSCIFTGALASSMPLMDALSLFQFSHFGTGRRMLGKVVKFGFTPANCICMKVFKALSMKVFHAYHEIISFHEMISLLKHYVTQFINEALQAI